MPKGFSDRFGTDPHRCWAKLTWLLGTVNIAGTELGSQTISVPVEQQQRVVTGRFEMPVVGALLLLLMGRVP